MLYPSKFDRLRLGSSDGLMTLETFKLIVDEHRRTHAVHLFSWRHGPEGKVSVYDYNMPFRTGFDEDARVGWGQEDWDVYSFVLNVPSDYMKRLASNTKPGYKDILARMLAEGCLKPSRCLDRWMHEGSEKYCNPTDARLLYMEN